MASLVAASFPDKVERCVFVDILGPFALTPGTSPKRLRASIASRSESLKSRSTDVPHVGMRVRPTICSENPLRSAMRVVSHEWAKKNVEPAEETFVCASYVASTPITGWPKKVRLT